MFEGSETVEAMMRSMRLGLVSLGVLLSAGLVAACGGDDSSGGGAAATTSTGTGGGSSAIPCDGAPAELSLGGVWAAYGKLSVDLQGVPGGAITLCPADQTGEARILMFVEMQPDASDPTKIGKIHAALCSLELPVVTALVGDCKPDAQNLVATQIIAPDTLVDALPNVPTTDASATLDGTAPGAGVVIDGLTVTVGSTASGAAMPAWSSDDVACADDQLGRGKTCETTCVSDCASLRDDDGDGFPGVTVHVCGYTPDEQASQAKCDPANPGDGVPSVEGLGYLDIEVAPKLTGSAKSSCELEGTVATPILYNVVGADVFLGPGPISVTSAIKSLPKFSVDPAASRFRMVRIDGKYGAPDLSVDPTAVPAACKAIVTNVNQIFE